MSDVVCDCSARGYRGGGNGFSQSRVEHRAANAAAAANTTALLAAGADEVSTAVARCSRAHGQAIRRSRPSATFHAQFVQALTAGGSARTPPPRPPATSPLLASQRVRFLANTGRPLISSTNGAPGTRANMAGTAAG
ncbi:PE family protein [Mycobacterium tuberculosis]|uniref:PE family protein n=1 Tax=Mycobacterium tuberculosis TaxID=1773 RepID=UPI003D7DC73B